MVLFKEISYDYDEECDIIYMDFNLGVEYEHSVDFFENDYICVIDLSKDNEIMGLEFINFSAALGVEFDENERIKMVDLDFDEDNIFLTIYMSERIFGLKLKNSYLDPKEYCD